MLVRTATGKVAGVFWSAVTGAGPATTWIRDDAVPESVARAPLPDPPPASIAIAPVYPASIAPAEGSSGVPPTVMPPEPGPSVTAAPVAATVAEPAKTGDVLGPLPASVTEPAVTVYV